MKFYVYEVDTMDVVEVVDGDSNEECEAKVQYAYDWEEYGATYSTTDLNI